MNTPSRTYTVDTSHGSLAVEERGSGQIPVLLIHGNSSCRQVFQNQLDGQLVQSHRLIAVDLPGHGDSSNAVDPVTTYTRPGLADAMIELLERIGVARVAVFGWSLGGHIGIEMAARFPGLLGLMVSGSPPVGQHGMSQGFQSHPQRGTAGKATLSPEEAESFLFTIFGDSVAPFLREALIRTDPRFRPRLFEAARSGAGVDQREVVENSPIPFAVVNGGADEIVNLDYFDSVRYANLWEGKCYRLPELGHAPFWQGPQRFDPFLERFLRDVAIHNASYLHRYSPKAAESFWRPLGGEAEALFDSPNASCEVNLGQQDGPNNRTDYLKETDEDPKNV